MSEFSEKVLKNSNKDNLIAITVLHPELFVNTIFLESRWFKDTRNPLPPPPLLMLGDEGPKIIKPRFI